MTLRGKLLAALLALAVGAVLFCVPASCRAEDSWLVPYRIAYVTDAIQTRQILLSPERWSERNPIYHGMSADLAPIAVIGINWLQERAITGIRDRKWREVIGWIVTVIEVDCVMGNARVGVRVRF